MNFKVNLLSAHSPVSKECTIENKNSHYALRFIPVNAAKDEQKLSRGREISGASVVNIWNVPLPVKSENLSAVRKALGQMIADAQSYNFETLDLYIPSWKDSFLSNESGIQLIAETFTLAIYKFEADTPEYSFNRNDTATLKKLTLRIAESEIKDSYAAAAHNGMRLGQSINYSRYLSDLPANVLTPDRLVNEGASRLAGKTTSRILNETQLQNEGFGGLIAVGKGSNNPPRLGIYEYNHPDAKTTIVLVGKGVTFDTGGYSIKPKLHHNEMKYDMCGAANVLAVIEHIAERQWPVRIVALIACVENMVSANAIRPGDVYKSWNGKTIDVFNTDAEGRLILSDILAYSKTFSPDYLVDIATLTGGASQIAGSMAAILCSNTPAEAALFKECAKKAGERFLELEILPDAIDDMKGQVSDLSNMHGEWSTGAPTMYAAAFLQSFVPENVPWLHLDIANMAWAGRTQGYLNAKLANGYGARALVHWVANKCGQVP